MKTRPASHPSLQKEFERPVQEVTALFPELQMPLSILQLFRANRMGAAVKPWFLPVFLGLCLVLGRPPGLQALSLDKTYTTRYADIFYAKAQELHSFTRNIGSGIRFLTESPERNPLLARNRVDRIVDLVARLLDMRPEGLHFKIELYRTQGELDRIYHGHGMMGSAPPAFYVHATRTIAVEFETVTDRILAHEIAHAVICFYFGTPPPARTQEVLAQYVDKHLGDE